jgi:hypothetical protein
MKVQRKVVPAKRRHRSRTAPPVPQIVSFHKAGECAAANRLRVLADLVEDQFPTELWRLEHCPAWHPPLSFVVNPRIGWSTTDRMYRRGADRRIDKARKLTAE